MPVGLAHRLADTEAEILQWRQQPADVFARGVRFAVAAHALQLVAAPHRRPGRQAGDDRQVAGQRLVQRAFGPRHRRVVRRLNRLVRIPDPVVIRAQAEHVRKADPLQPLGLLVHAAIDAPHQHGELVGWTPRHQPNRQTFFERFALRLRQIQPRDQRVLVRPQGCIDRVLDRLRHARREVLQLEGLLATPCKDTVTVARANGTRCRFVTASFSRTLGFLADEHTAVGNLFQPDAAKLADAGRDPHLVDEARESRDSSCRCDRRSTADACRD